MGDFDVGMLNKRLSDIKRIFSSKWSDEYFLKLGIFDHLHEVVALMNKWKLNKTAENEQAFSKELMDLFILLLLWHKDEDLLFNERLDKFLSYISNTEENDKSTPDLIDLSCHPQILSIITSFYGNEKMNEYIEKGFWDLCLRRRPEFAEPRKQDE